MFTPPLLYLLTFFVQLFTSAGAAAAADGSVAAQRGSLRALGKPATTPYKVPPAHGLYKDPNLKPVKPTKPTKPTIDWRCKDTFDAADWINSCTNDASGGKDGEDTCQPCCECDCDSSADVPDATAKETCDVDLDFETASNLECADHGHVDPVDNSCDHADVVAACDAICNA